MENPIYLVIWVNFQLKKTIDPFLGESVGKNRSNFMQKRPIDLILSLEHLDRYGILSKPLKSICTQQAHKKQKFQKINMKIFNFSLTLYQHGDVFEPFQAVF